MDDIRLLSIASPLGGDALIPTRLEVVERIGAPYSIQVDVLALKADLLPKDLLTKPITVAVRQHAGSPVRRYFHGLVAEWQRLGPGAAGRTAFRLVAVPGIWRLGLRQHCRIFQAMTAKEVIEKVLAEHAQPTPKWGILPSLQAMPYCTQFNETDLHFVSRLMEEHGLAYYHVHKESEHELHISSTAQGFPVYTGGKVRVQHGSDALNEFSEWQRVNRMRSAEIDLKDMDAERNQPSVVLSKASKTRTYAGEPEMWAAGKVTHWPGGMSTRPGVDPSAIGVGALETSTEHFEGLTTDPRLAPGVRVDVGVLNEAGAESTAQYIVTSVRHEAHDDSALVAGAGGTESYVGSLELVSTQRTWMPQPEHARPVMTGLYSAKVTGPEGEQIHVDSSGRIKVHFRWDLTGKKDDSSSCWVRVAQPAAGAWGGTWFLPRVGDEVLVAFLDGDPDRPVVTGSVYSLDAPPPFSPKEHPSQSGVSTRSYPGGSKNDANVLRFEDKAGAEEVLLHAQHNLTVEVEHARKATIEQSDDTLLVQKGDRLTTVDKGNDNLTLNQGNRNAKILQGNDDLTVNKGNVKITCSMGSIQLEAMQKITLKVGKNSVVIDQTGITTDGLMITDKASAMHKTEAPMVQTKGIGMVQVQGGIVMLN